MGIWKFLSNLFGNKIKYELVLLISNQMSSLLSLYEYSFYKNPIWPKGITYNACPWALGGFVDLEVFVIGSLNYF